MFIYRDKICAGAGCYLVHKTKNVIGLSVPAARYSVDDFDEVSFGTLDVRVHNGMVSWGGGKFCNRPKVMTYAGIKTSIIKSRYSDDDQIALMLNRERSAEDAALYDEMQRWRDFAAAAAKAVTTAWEEA